MKKFCKMVWSFLNILSVLHPFSSSYHLVPLVLHKILLRCIYFYLWVFCCMCIWTLHVCRLLVETWSSNRIVLLPLAARLLGLPVVLGPRGGQKQGYRWLWVQRRKGKLASLRPGQLGYWGNRPVYIELEDKETGEIHLICIMWPFVPMKKIQVFQPKLRMSTWPIL